MERILKRGLRAAGLAELGGSVTEQPSISAGGSADAIWLRYYPSLL